jgi:hypothetical protein
MNAMTPNMPQAKANPPAEAIAPQAGFRVCRWCSVWG